MQLTTEQVLALAPDASSAAAGKKLGGTKGWRGLGRSPAAIWGECQGSALYQVRVDLTDLATKCSCPSRKFPCKHSLGLLLLAAANPAAVPEGEPPEWVGDWLARRAATAERREEKQAQQAEAPAATAQPADAAKGGKGADRRLARVRAGIDALDRWLDDLIRHGLAGLDGQPATIWEDQAKRLVDAQAPGLAAQVRRLAAIPHATPDWPARLLDHLGRLALLTQAFRQIERLDPALQEDVRGLVGWSLDYEEVAARGETVHDDWAVVGQRFTTEERLRTQWSWLVGAGTARTALVLQFAYNAQPFKELIAPGTRFAADLTFWPSAAPQRALIRARHGAPSPIAATPPGPATVADFLAMQAEATARQPWLERGAAVLRGVVPLGGGEGPWQVRDATGAALPLRGAGHWGLLAVSGGHPLDLAAEWDGAALLPLGALAEGAWRVLAAD